MHTHASVRVCIGSADLEGAKVGIDLGGVLGDGELVMTIGSINVQRGGGGGGDDGGSVSSGGGGGGGISGGRVNFSGGDGCGSVRRWKFDLWRRKLCQLKDSGAATRGWCPPAV